MCTKHPPVQCHDTETSEACTELKYFCLVEMQKWVKCAWSALDRVEPWCHCLVMQPTPVGSLGPENCFCIETSHAYVRVCARVCEGLCACVCAFCVCAFVWAALCVVVKATQINCSVASCAGCVTSVSLRVFDAYNTPAKDMGR